MSEFWSFTIIVSAPAGADYYFFLPSTTLYYTFTYKGKITKNVKETKKKVAKLQFTKVIENYNLTYLYANT